MQDKFLIILRKGFLRTLCELSRSDGGMFVEDALPLKKGIDEAVTNEPEGSNPCMSRA
jgi:hypothetical protein